MPNFPGGFGSVITTPASLDRDDTVMIAVDGVDKEVALYALAGILGTSATYVVASSGAPQVLKDRADFVCDGTADQTEINAALALGSVQLTDGIFNISAPVTMIRSGSRLQGTGKYADRTSDGLQYGSGSMVLVKTGFAGAAAIIAASGSSTLAGSVMTLRDMSIRGTNTAAGFTPVGSNIHGVNWRAYQGHAENLEIVGMSGHGVYVQAYAGWDIYDTRFLSIQGAGNTLSGFYTDAADGHLSSSVFNNNGQEGIRLGGSSWQITQVHCYTNSSHNIWLQAGASRAKISNCKIEHAGKHGIFCDGSSGSGQEGVQIVGCGFNCNSEATHNAWQHLQIEGPGSFWKGVIMGCHFGNSDGATNLPQYAIAVADQTRYLACIGNNLGADNGGASNGAYLGGATSIASSKYRGNIGITDQGAA